MREPTSKVKAAGQCGGDNSVGNPGIGSRSIEKDKKGGVSAFINDGICADILDISFLRMLKKNPSATNISTSKEFELWDDEFDSKIDFSQYRARLVWHLWMLQLTTRLVHKKHARVSCCILHKLSNPHKDLVLYFVYILILDSYFSF